MKIPRKQIIIYKNRKEIAVMSDKAVVYARIDPELKEEAENILSRLGITASGAINMFYRQIVLRKGIPFELSVPSQNPYRNDDYSSISIKFAGDT